MNCNKSAAVQYVSEENNIVKYRLMTHKGFIKRKQSGGIQNILLLCRTIIDLELRPFFF